MGRASAQLGVPRLQAYCTVTIDFRLTSLPPLLAVFRKDASPGPGYFVDPAISRFGRDGTPSYSILGRQKDPSE